MGVEAAPARGGGAQGRENVGMSNHYPNEKLEPRKSKVSVALAINHGLGGPKAIPKGAVDGQLVNIPALPNFFEAATREIRRRALLVLHRLSQVNAGTGGRFGFYRANVVEEPSKKNRQELKVRDPYRKPTQVDRARSPRGTSDSSLRNSAKKRP